MFFSRIIRKVLKKTETKGCDNPLLIAHRGGPDYDTYRFSKKRPIGYKVWESTKTAYKRAVNNGV